MTLHEAASVFLIIGGVLLGPIEGQNLSNIDVVHDCVRAHGGEPGTPMEAAPESCPRITLARETTAETCERAMREIGAVPWYLLPPNEPRQWVNELPKHLSDGTPVSEEAKNYVHFWTLRPIGTTSDPKPPVPVLCIPAPSGLVQ